jgi:hypothetical protein
MPDCHHCDATFEDDEGLAIHLASAHEWEELGRIDRRRIEVLVPEEVPQDEAEQHLDATSDLDALLDQEPTVDAIEQALEEHERLIRQAQQEGERSHANDLFWDYFEPLATHLDAVVMAEGWSVLADLMERYEPQDDANDPAPTPVIGNAIGRYLIRTRLTDGIHALPAEGLTYLFALREEAGDAGWEEAGAYGWGINHPTEPIADRIQTTAREDVYWVSNALEHAFYADQHAACDCLAEIVTDDDVDDVRFVFDAVSRCDRMDRWPSLPRYWDWEDAVDISFEWESDIVTRIRDLVAETERIQDLPDDWSFQDLAV